jgi:hypothetical protein
VASHAALYPEGWTIPLAAAAAVLAALLPRVGLALLSVVLLLPVAVFSPGTGVVLAAAAATYYLVFGLRRPDTALLPVLAAAMGFAGIGLAYPAIAGSLGRLRRGLFLALAGAAALTGLQLVTGDSPLDYLGISNDWSLVGLRDVYNPWEALRIISEPLRQQPVLALQPVVWLLAAAPAAILVRRRNLLADLTGLLLVNAVLLAGYLALPYIAPPFRLSLDPLLKTFTLCVIIQFVLLLISPRAKRPTPLSHERA